MNAPQRTSPLVWVAAGCGLLLAIGVVLVAVAVFLFTRADETPPAEVQTVPAPTGFPMAPQVPSAQPVAPAAPMPVNRSPLLIAAQVTTANGIQGVNPGMLCAFQIDIAPLENSYWCHTTLMCGSTLLYGGERTGFFPCTVTDAPRAIVGQDNQTTSNDGDASFSINSSAFTATVFDDANSGRGAFRVDLRITGVQ